MSLKPHVEQYLSNNLRVQTHMLIIIFQNIFYLEIYKNNIFFIF
jgi:hypothetical protein